MWNGVRCLLAAVVMVAFSVPQGAGALPDGGFPAKRVTVYQTLPSFDDSAAYREAKGGPRVAPRRAAAPKIQKQFKSAAKPKAQPFRGLAKSGARAASKILPAVRSAGRAAQRATAAVKRGAASGIRMARGAGAAMKASATKALAAKRAAKPAKAATKPVAQKANVKAGLAQKKAQAQTVKKTATTGSAAKSTSSASAADGKNVAGYAANKGKLTEHFHNARDAINVKTSGTSKGEKPPTTNNTPKGAPTGMTGFKP